MKKLIVLISFLILLSGCTVNYNITIDENNIKENIVVEDNITNGRTKEDIVSFYNNWYPVYLYEGVIDDYSVKVDDAVYYNKGNIVETENGYNYSYSYNHKIDDYKNSTIWNLYLVNNTLSNTSKNISIYSGKGMQLFNKSFIDNLNVSITTSLKVGEHNADRVEGNTYIWEYNLSNYRDKSIELELLKDEETNEEEEPSNPEVKPDTNREEKEEQPSEIEEVVTTKSNNMVLILSVLGIFFIVLIILLKIRK